jgi:hypothetical protein
MSQELQAYAAKLKDDAIRSGKDRFTATSNARMNFLKGLLSTGVSLAIPGGFLGLLGKGIGGLSKLKTASAVTSGAAGNILDIVKGLKTGVSPLSEFKEMGEFGQKLQNLLNPTIAKGASEGGLKRLGKGLFDKALLDTLISEKEFLNPDLETDRQLARQTGWMGPVEEGLGEYSAWIKSDGQSPYE